MAEVANGNLFGQDDDEARRQRLRGRGWKQAAGTIRGRLAWRDPQTGALREEREAFDWLLRTEAWEAKQAENR